MEKHILDIGSGDPEHPDHLFQKGSGTLHVDIDKRAFHVEVVGDILNLPFETNSVDKINASNVFEHLDNPMQALRECYRILKPNGALTIAVPNASFFKWKLSGKTHIFSWNQYTLFNFARKAFTDVKVQSRLRNVGNRRRKLINLILCFFYKENEVFAVCKKEG